MALPQQKELSMPDRPALRLAQIQAAMQAMMARAMQTPEAPVAMAVVDATGNLLAYATMDNLRLYSRRHALRKAYTAAIMGLDTGAHAQRLHSQGRSISELGDPQLTFGQGGLVIVQDGVILGGIGVGGYPSGQQDEDLARVGLDAMQQ
jgi:glc operon protein GlcG